MTIRTYSDKSVTDEKSKIVSRRKGYSDLDLKLRLHPTHGDIVPLKDIDAVKQSVKNLILTSKKERLFQPWLGSGVQDLLFEPSTAITRTLLRRAIIDVVNRYEPRVKMNDVVVEDRSDINAYNITLNFTIINLVQDVDVQFYLERVR